jgi:hypothetical protein
VAGFNAEHWLLTWWWKWTSEQLLDIDWLGLNGGLKFGAGVDHNRRTATKETDAPCMRMEGRD